jgi:hypothetical protein
MRSRYVAGLLIGALVLATAATGTAQAETPPTPPASPRPVIADCPLDAILVPTCPQGLLFGASPNGYEPDDYDPSVFGPAHREFIGADTRYGRKVDIVHTYHPAGKQRPFDLKQPLGQTERAYAAQGRIPLVNYKPAADWAAVARGDYNEQIKEVAALVKTVPGKVMINLFHEPENDVRVSASCRTKVGSDTDPKNSPADYRAMWRVVRKLFEDATNVIWVMNYMTLPDFECLVPEMWPGDDLVDWVAYDAYSSDGTANEITRFAAVLTNQQDCSVDPDTGAKRRCYLDKPWMLAEFGVRPAYASQAQARAFYGNVSTMLDNNEVPNLRALVIFDSAADNGNFQVGYQLPVKANGKPDPKGVPFPDPDEQAAFNALAQNKRFLNLVP